jgi:hypothetical protein
MLSHRSIHKTAALLVLAGVVGTAPSFAFADRDHGKHRREHNQRHDHDSRRGDRDDRWDRRDGRHHQREVRWEGHRHDRNCGHREVRYVEVIRRPAPRFTVAVQLGQPYYPPAPVYYAPPVCAPPAPVYVSSAPTCGAYYDPYCDARYTSFELYLEHVSRKHGISVAIRN